MFIAGTVTICSASLYSSQCTHIYGTSFICSLAWVPFSFRRPPHQPMRIHFNSFKNEHGQYKNKMEMCRHTHADEIIYYIKRHYKKITKHDSLWHKWNGSRARKAKDLADARRSLTISHQKLKTKCLRLGLMRWACAAAHRQIDRNHLIIILWPHFLAFRHSRTVSIISICVENWDRYHRTPDATRNAYCPFGSFCQKLRV